MAEPILIDRPDTIQVSNWDFSVDWEAASRSIHPFEGIVYVEMAPREEQKSGVYLTDSTQRALRSDIGIVLARGKDRKEPFLTGSGFEERPLPLEVSPGDKVLVDPYRGDAYEGFSAGGFTTDGVVRVYGDASCDEWRPRGRQIDENIMAIVEEAPVRVVEVVVDSPKPRISLRPVGRMCLIRRQELRQTTESGIVLPGRAQKRSPVAQIVAASALAQEHGRLPGMTVHYRLHCTHPLKMYELDLECTSLDLPGPIEDYAFIPYENLTAAL